MKTISQSFILAGIVLALLGGVFAFSAMNADAQTTCGACEEPNTPSTPTGGGGDDNDGPTPPKCTSLKINKTVAVDGESYTVSWDASPSEATFKMNGTVVPAKDSLTAQFDDKYSSIKYVLYGENGGYKCAEEVVVEKKKTTPTCDISANISEVDNIGDLFTISWEGTPSDANFTINNSSVDAIGNATFDFIGPNFERFTLRGEIDGESCSDVVEITKKPTHEPKCELTVTKSVDKHTAVPGEQVTYTIKVKNTGTADCTGGGVRIQDEVEANLEYISNTITSNLSEGYGSLPVYNVDDRILRFNGNTLNPGEEGTITWIGKILTPHTCGDYEVENQARATARELNNFQDWSYSQIVKTAVDYDCDVPTHPVCTSFTATPGTLPYGGGQVTLDWDLLNVATAMIDNGIGDVTVGNGTVNGAMSGTQIVNVTESTTFTLTAKDVDNKEVSCQAPVVVEDPAPAPTCDLFTATPGEIFVGGTSVLTWETTNAVQVFLNNGIGNDNGNLTVDGSFQVSPLTDTTYVLTVIGAQDQVVDCHVPVKVKPVVDDMPVCKAFTATPNTLPFGGGNTTLEWEVEDATDVTIDNGVGTNLGLTGSQSVAVTDTTTFVLTATDADGDKVTCPALVEVEEPEKPAVCEAFSATPSALPVGGGDVVLNWTVLDATSVSIDNGVGTNLGLTGSSNPINVTQSTTFTLTAIGEDGKEVTCPAPVAVADPVVFTCENNVSFSATDTSIRRGSETTLNWNTTNVDSLTISEINATALSGSETVSPTVDTTYVLEATQGNQTIPCPVTVEVTTGGGGGGSSSPRCELDISAERINAGEEITLTWDSSRARELKLTDSFGNVLVDTDGKLSDEKDDLFEGSLTLNPTRNTTYTLLVERGSKDRECEVDVEMDDEVVVLQVRDQQPLVAGISLTQVPYTGFEAGPVMTVLFYMLLIAWALYITYVLVIPKTQLAVEKVAVVPKTNEDLMANAEKIRPDVFAAMPTNSVVASTATVPANLPTAGVAPSTPAMPVVAEVDETDTIENQAHALQALISSDAARSIAAMTTESNQAEVVKKIVADAKGAFPLEDGWVVINQSRLEQITDTQNVELSPSPTGAGSLAEAIVTGNIVAAYDMVGARPMIALADAAADLDALYRIRKGAAAEVSELLKEETTNLSDEQITQMIAALTGALDGTYTDEASAVKMAIMKAVKVAA